MGKDIFEVMQEHIGCTYISDLLYHRKSVSQKLKIIDMEEFPAQQLDDFSYYVFGIKYIVLKELLSLYGCRKKNSVVEIENTFW